MKFSNSKLSESRLKRYVEEKLHNILEELKKDNYENSYMIWGLDIPSIYNQEIQELKKEGSGDAEKQREYAARATINECVDNLKIAVEMSLRLFNEKILNKDNCKAIFGMSIMDLNEIFLYVSRHDSLDVLTNCAGVVKDMGLVEFGSIKAYVGLIQDGLISVEIAAERIGATVEEVEGLMEKGIDMRL